MATSIHVPAPLLKAVDREAKRRSVSRSKFIVRALEQALAAENDDWPADFFERLATVGPDVGPAVDEMMRAIRSSRTGKKPPRL
jgi:hypothetical protein